MATDSKKQQFWSEHFENWEASGLTQRAYCAREGLALTTFDHWRRKRGKQRTGKAAQTPATGPLTLVPVQLVATDSDVQLHSPSGWHITLPATLGPDTLTHILTRLP